MKKTLTTIIIVFINFYLIAQSEVVDPITTSSTNYGIINSDFGYGIGVDQDGVGHIAANFNTPVNIMDFYSNGKIAIGNDTPSIGTSHRLFVEGGITSEEVVINALTSSKEWPDYVFKEDYSLMSIFELKEFINNNGHLPNVPTAVEINEEGQNLGEINAVLVEKIEELTLYLIKQQEEIEKLKKLIDQK